MTDSTTPASEQPIAPPQQNTRMCRTCKEVKPKTDFYLTTYCKPCHIKIVQARQQRLKAAKKRGFESLTPELLQFVKDSIKAKKTKKEIYSKINITGKTYTVWLVKFAHQLAG